MYCFIKGIVKKPLPEAVMTVSGPMGSGDDLAPVWCQATAWDKDDLLSIGPGKTIFFSKICTVEPLYNTVHYRRY